MGKQQDKVKKTNVVAGEERNLDADVTETAEQAGRPVNDTTERAAEAGVPPAGAVSEDADGNEVVQDPVHADDDKTKSDDDNARNDSTPPQDKPVVGAEANQPASDVEADDAEAKADADDDEAEEASDDKPSGKGGKEKKGSDPSDLLKNIDSQLTKLLGEQGNAELKKATDAIRADVGKVEKSLSSLADRVKAIEDQPMPTKGQRYQLVTKGNDDEEQPDEVKELLKRRDELAEHPHLAKTGEVAELAIKLRRANLGKPQVVS